MLQFKALLYSIKVMIVAIQVNINQVLEKKMMLQMIPGKALIKRNQQFKDQIHDQEIRKVLGESA